MKPKPTLARLTQLEAQHVIATRARQCSIRYEARRVCLALSVKPPDWCAERRATPEAKPLPNPIPKPVVGLDDAQAALDLLRDFRRANPYIALVAKADGAVELHDTNPINRRIATYSGLHGACNAALAVESGTISWRPVKLLPPRRSVPSFA